MSVFVLTDRVVAVRKFVSEQVIYIALEGGTFCILSVLQRQLFDTSMDAFYMHNVLIKYARTIQYRHTVEVGSLHTLRLESLELVFQLLHKFLVNKL